MDSPSEFPALDIHGLSYGIAGRTLLDGLDLRVDRGESVSVVGPSGSGKSTLLGCVLGLIRPDSGVVAVCGTDLVSSRTRTVERLRGSAMGVVFQFGELLPELTPVENVALGALLAGVPAAESYRRATELLAELGVPLAETPTNRLSGGERQRTAVARALINRPALLLADEPTGALDVRTRDGVADLLYELPARWNCALVVVTHDLTVAARADRCLQLLDGSLVACDPVVGQ